LKGGEESGEIVRVVENEEEGLESKEGMRGEDGERLNRIVVLQHEGSHPIECQPSPSQRERVMGWLREATKRRKAISLPFTRVYLSLGKSQERASYRLEPLHQL
jgi:hypothetical protein